MQAAAHFFQCWFRGIADGLVELRYKRDGRMIQEFSSLDSLPNMAHRSVDLSSKGAEVYYGVSTRYGRKGRKENVAQVPGFFADLDFDRFDAGGIEAMERLDGFKPKPTNVIHTGAGCHVYWKLREPLYPEPRTHAMLKAVVREVGADPAATDLSRVLRVPGTWSWKRDMPVRLLRCSCSI